MKTEAFPSFIDAAGSPRDKSPPEGDSGAQVEAGDTGRARQGWGDRTKAQKH